ncbi:hypothetical protein MMAD_35250 [Mycolicibacterium madagascariense]|uniref:Uncharacterized protein n=1 Tax=Mycolicibacterium madagascariense TaxID=212765 RepID=A0A7I7XJ64_9MYCO|nr:hypothetical protein [Mycolicibacterium madagascariense]MCV7014607.1 hypothetical protein [Mycolicibacterium madagascariense]BBZ29230.1 hypothetical protein MMAD_35250 [Mycolicibacterium madagascariense]
MDLMTDHLAEARSAHQRRDWDASHGAYARADAVGPLATDDVEAYAATAWRLGHAQEAVRLAERVYGRVVRADPAAAAQAAVDLAQKWLTRGDVNICRIWMDRSRRLLDPASAVPTHGYLGYLEAVVALRTRAVEGLPARALHDTATATGDPALLVLSSVVAGCEAWAAGRVDDGRALIERAIPALEAGEVRLEWAGDAYALVLFDCRELVDPPTLTRWAASMATWCGMHDAPIYHRVLRVHHADSDGELLTAASSLNGVHAGAAAAALRRLDELRRRGDARGTG